MLHSGSRNIGKEIAERHIYKAKGLEHNLGLPDRDLAVFLAGTAEMDAYLSDLYWAQEYAARNRAVMMALLCEAVARSLAERGPEVVRRADHPHHNQMAQETYVGVNLVMTRDPQGRDPRRRRRVRPDPVLDGHRLVRCLGNEASYCSASHGAVAAPGNEVDNVLRAITTGFANRETCPSWIGILAP